MLRFLADTFLLEGFGFDAPKPVEELGVYLPGRGDVTLEEALDGRDPASRSIGITFYRSHRLTGNTDFVDGLCAAIERAGGHPLPVWSYTLRREPDDGRVAALELLDGHVDALVTTMLAHRRRRDARRRASGTRARSRRSTCRSSRRCA